MKDLSALFVTLKRYDVIDLGVCYRLHRLCNGKQFNTVPGTVFANFINLRNVEQPIYVKPRQKLKVCFLIYLLSVNINDDSISEDWKDSLLAKCGISKSYYASHYKDAEYSAAKGMTEFTAKLKRIIVAE